MCLVKERGFCGGREKAGDDVVVSLTVLDRKWIFPRVTLLTEEDWAGCKRKWGDWLVISVLVHYESKCGGLAIKQYFENTGNVIEKKSISLPCRLRRGTKNHGRDGDPGKVLVKNLLMLR